jgi:predicted RNA-binding Zn-ribbon protein involved in translation (DUF1610 family)
MPDDLQLLTCYACGGQLTIDTAAETIHCPYCGSAYLKRDLSDDVPDCPICGRDDLVIKASAIPKGHFLYETLDFDLDDFPLPDGLDDDFDEDDDDDDDDDDRAKKFTSWLWLPVVIIFLLFRLGFFNFGDLDTGLLILIMVVFTIGGTLINYAFRKMGIKEEKKDPPKSLRKTLKALNRQHFYRLKPLYDKLHFCQRDQVIFIEGSERTAKPEDMQAYLSESLYDYSAKK